jgi:peptidoglycan/xylan/chitin deacetylase (PgdA/CDA1 family)
MGVAGQHELRAGGERKLVRGEAYHRGTLAIVAAPTDAEIGQQTRQRQPDQDLRHLRQDLQGSTVSRKLAAIIATGAAATLIVSWLTAIAVGHSNSPTAAAASVSPVAIQTIIRTPTEKVIFLSFDDGPDPTWTPEILRILAKYRAKATFFELGQMIHAHPGLREQVLAGGNTIGNHSISHPHLTRVSAARRHHEIFDGPKSHCFRPPYGESNARVRADIKAAGMIQVQWNVDPYDWARPGSSAILHRILNHTQRRKIILMHDGGGNRSETVAALDKLLPLLKAQGYSFPAMRC